MKNSLAIWLILAFAFTLPRVSKSADGPDAWAQWLNACTEEFMLWRPEIQAFNAQVVAAYAQPSAEVAFSFGTHVPVAYRRQRSALLDSLLRHARRFEPGYVPAGWADWVRQLEQVNTDSESEMDALIRYVRASAWKSDADFQQAFHHLKRLGLLYADHAALQNRLAYSLNGWVSSVIPVQANAQSLLLLREMQTWTYTGRELARAILAENESSVREYTARLESQKAQAVNRKSALLAPWTGGPGGAGNPARLFETGSAACQRLVDHAREFLSAPPTASHYGDAGKGCYFFNEKILPILNGPDQGLIFAFNSLRNLSAEPLTPGLLEPPRFCPAIRPPRAKVETLEPAAAATNWFFVVDVSGSMARQDKLPLFKGIFPAWLADLGATAVSLVTFSGGAKVAAPLTPATDRDRLLAALSQLEIGGTTSAADGIALAYQQVQAHAASSSSSMVLITDGGFDTDDGLLELVEAGRKNQVYLHLIYFGQYPQQARQRMEKLISAGGGAFYVAQAGKLRPLISQLVTDDRQIRQFK